ncbi:unannotated protein [freshwater metagenome]|uniref:Unannotated protein n=1 Tax=freshwater metagenome TaxID=449393 RepID=A0A6J6FJ10_9ZZZZ
MTSRSQFRRDAIPHARVRGKTMDQYERYAGLIKTAGERPQFDAGCNCYPKFFGRHFLFRPASAIDSHKPIVDNTSTLVRGHGVEPRTASTKAPIMSA